MAVLTPNATASVLGVQVHEKIIPDGTRWKNSANAKAAGSSAGSLYKAERKLSGGTGNPQYVTIHNTNDLARVNDDAEQYTRSTYNENMGTSRVHYYVDENGAWQNLKAGTGLFPADPIGSAEVSWHSGDGKTKDGGNETSLSIECIMHETPATDAKSYDNTARLAAWLLHKHGLVIDRLVTHTYWVAKAAGKTSKDVDEQCVTALPKEKWCPTYIFNSNNKSTAKKNWLSFKSVVNGYLQQLNGTAEAAPAPSVPDIDNTPIMGDVKATAAQAIAYIRRINKSVPQSVIDMVPLYWSEGKAEGVRGDIAFAQSCLETGNFTFSGSAVALSQNNFCGMGVTGKGVKGNSFATPQLGIRAQVQHLKAYASTDALHGSKIDPRFDYVSRCCAPYVEWLGQKENPDGKGWASGADYGSKILRILSAIMSTEAAAEHEATARPSKFEPYLVKCTVSALNIRKGPGTDTYKTGKTITNNGIQYTIVAEQSGAGSKAGWGQLKSGAGWVSLDYVKRV